MLYYKILMSEIKIEDFSDDRKLTNEEKKVLKSEAKEILEKKNSKHYESEEKQKRQEQTIWCIIKEKFSFEKFEFLEQSGEKKTEIALLIKKQNTPDKLYWMEIILSTLIATFGLLQNSVAVIIGAMLIAPLIRPMQGMSFAMATGQSSFFWKATNFLFKSVVISIVISFLFALLIPLKIEQPEILARISPNILDLFIAIFSAIIALLSLGYARLSASVAGVAMSASLMPPLAVVGIELSLGNMAAAWGSFLLFFVNFLAIIFVGVIVLIAYGFTPTQEIKKQVSARKILTLLVIILFTSVPLYSSLFDISAKIEAEKESIELLTKIIPEKIQEGKLKELKVLSVTDKSIKIIGQLQVPENVTIFKSSKLAIIAELENHFNKEVNIDFETIRTANFSSPNISNKLKKDLLAAFQDYLQDLAPQFTPLQVSAIERDENVWEISSIISIPDGKFLTDEIKLSFANKFLENFEEKVIFKWVTIAGSPKQEFEKELTKHQLIQADITNNIQEFLSRPEMKGVKIENIIIDIKENFETHTTEEITLSARVLYVRSIEKKKQIGNSKFSINIAENTLQKIKELHEQGGLSDDILKNLLKEYYTENFSIENKNTIKKSISSSSDFVFKSEKEITEGLKEVMKALSYSDLTLELNYIPYVRKTIKISPTDIKEKNDIVSVDSNNNLSENILNITNNIKILGSEIIE